MSEYESLSKWVHKFNQTDEMVRGGFTAVVERKPSANNVKVFWSGETVLEYEITNGRICVKKSKKEWCLQGRGAERIIKKYFSLREQLGDAVK